jgi:hypothetical protein
VPKTPISGAGLERNHLPLSAEITCRFRPKSGAGLLRFLHFCRDATTRSRAEMRAIDAGLLSVDCLKASQTSVHAT